MSRQNKVSGVVLAGGLARRMGYMDKGLIVFDGQPLISYALAALTPLVNDVLISANRNQEIYRTFGFEVISDGNDRFEGPLAGILAAMRATSAAILLVLPCDSPRIKSQHLRKLLDALQDDVDIAVACDGKRLHPVFAAVKTQLQSDLELYLQKGERKLQTWIEQHDVVKVDFSDTPEIFVNINTPEEIHAFSGLKNQ